MFKQYRQDIETALSGISENLVMGMANMIKSARTQSAAVYIVGNGGSAATASHFANDLVKACGIRAYSVPDMVPLVSANGNDHGWKEMYSRPLRSLLLPFDVVMGISCSGNSANVVEALMLARHYRLPGLKTIGLIGADLECAVAKLVPDILVNVPFRDIKVQEDCHMIICHAIAGALSNAPGKTPGVL